MCVFIALWEHQRMLWDVCDPTCKNRNKRTDVVRMSSCFNVKNRRDRNKRTDVARMARCFNGKNRNV